ncbi:hypothetical protein GCM10007907_05970 [Chitinimonas prasina]|uniref:Uncharacterized protein n=1 Tax=Chitinimonas prasina TaxID=1434937 RepID=A0ABQ5YA33_9NEIS|nr:hypothetical protein GCM10007907_05970 [Chitinimonas prasina]
MPYRRVCPPYPDARHAVNGVTHHANGGAPTGFLDFACRDTSLFSAPNKTPRSWFRLSVHTQARAWPRADTEQGQTPQTGYTSGLLTKARRHEIKGCIASLAYLPQQLHLGLPSHNPTPISRAQAIRNTLRPNTPS